MDVNSDATSVARRTLASPERSDRRLESRRGGLLGKIRASALEAAPTVATNVRSGSMTMADLETWRRFQIGSGAITDAEAEAWRSEAATP